MGILVLVIAPFGCAGHTTLRAAYLYIIWPQREKIEEEDKEDQSTRKRYSKEFGGRKSSCDI